jgi:large subunit ribosomal protein L10
VPTSEKARIIEETAALLRDAEGVVLASFSKVPVPVFNRIRRDLAQNGVRVKVVKNTLLKRAAEAVGIEGLEPYLVGPTMIAVSADPVAPARLLRQHASEVRTIEIKAGVLGRRALSAAETEALATLPGRDQLVAQVVGTLAAPLTRLVWALNGPLTGLVRALDQVRARQASAS